MLIRRRELSVKIIAIDSFKGSLSSYEAGQVAAEGIKCVYPDAKPL